MLPPTHEAYNKATNYAVYSTGSYAHVLELGPFDGTDTIALSRHTNEVVSVEGREENIQVINQNLMAHGVTNAKVLLGDLEMFPLMSLGNFDCVWASGVLYHMTDPSELIEGITEVTSFCLGWTHLSSLDSGHWQPESIELPLAGLSPSSWWYSPRKFVEVWTSLGWKCAFTTKPEPHPNGHLAAQFIARKS